MSKPDKHGEIYAARRAHTLVSHPEWYVDKNGNPKLNKDGEPSSIHGHNDALRYITKRALKDLWVAWRAVEKGR